ncbi:MAG: PD-(D/E)XK nuclease family protein [Candidatus Pacearchaeota archaeon]
MVVFSHSRLSTFEQCKLKYRFRYIDKIVPDIDKTIESHLGTIVHSALEWLYTEIKEKSRIPTIDEVITKYAEEWQDNYEDEIPIVRRDMQVKDYFNKGIKFLIDYYSKHKPFQDKTIAVEKEIIFNLDEEGKYKIRGFIDRLVYNLQTKEYEVHDYKTSGRLPTDEAIKNDRQLALYSIAIKEIYGQQHKGVALVWHYLSFNKRLDSKRTNDQLEQLKKETIDLIKEIENTTQFPYKKSSLCHWCEYKAICPAWGNKPPEKQLTLGEYVNKLKESKD